MPRSRKDSIVEIAEQVASALAGFDYGVDAEDFVFYELHRLIEEDRASFDDFELRVLIDAGVRAHVESNIQVRSQLARILRTLNLTGDGRAFVMKIVRAVEDLNADLTSVSVLVRSYAGYLLSRLEVLEPDSEDDRIASAADLLFESTGDRDAAETALAVLCAKRSPIAARVLAHAVSEPLLDEDLEAKAFQCLKDSWPLPRLYMFYSLQGHPHEDIPLRWFELFVEVDELTTVELILEEVRAHSDHPDYHEDLSALLSVLHGCRDPELEDKVLGVINASSTSRVAFALLRTFLEDHSVHEVDASSPWARHVRDLALNTRYLAAAALFDRGEREKAAQALKKILDEAPDYPFAVMLKNPPLSRGGEN